MRTRRRDLLVSRGPYCTGRWGGPPVTVGSPPRCAVGRAAGAARRPVEPPDLQNVQVLHRHLARSLDCQGARTRERSLIRRSQTRILSAERWISSLNAESLTGRPAGTTVGADTSGGGELVRPATEVDSDRCGRVSSMRSRSGGTGAGTSVCRTGRVGDTCAARRYVRPCRASARRTRCGRCSACKP
jgi:hypothetical protein